MLSSSSSQLIGGQGKGSHMRPSAPSVSRLIRHRVCAAGFQSVLRPDAVVPAGRQFLAKGRGNSVLARIAELDKVAEGAHSQPAGFEPVSSMWRRLASQYGDALALQEPHRPEAGSLSFIDLNNRIQEAAAGLASLGLRPGDKVALFAEASSRWVQADQGIMQAGGVGAVRGSASPVEELMYILGHAGCKGLVVQDAESLGRLVPHLSKLAVPLEFVAVLWGKVDAKLKEQVEAAIATSRQGARLALQATASGAALDGSEAGVALQPGSHAECDVGHPDCQEGLHTECLNHSSQQGHIDVGASGDRVFTWEEVLTRGSSSAGARFVPVQPQPDDLATLVYTSGTTGHPRGVMLSHRNLAYQVANLSFFLEVDPGDCILSVLPPWHIYQRTVSYYVFSRGGRQVLTTVRKFRDDLTAFPPDHLVCVPLVLDTLHSRVMQRLRSAPPLRRKIAELCVSLSTAYVRAARTADGRDLRYAVTPASWSTMLGAALLATILQPLHLLAARLVYSKVREALGVRRTIISGGGSLAGHLDDFFEVIGLPVLNGWGLTETSPVLACRRVVQNVRGSVGLPMPGTSLAVVDPDTLEPVPAGEAGLILARGPGVMQGYLSDPGASAAAFRAGGGWLDTGDLGWIAPKGVPGSDMGGNVVLTGRAKDTIVLSNGKNVQPQPLEDAVCASPLIKHALLMGQDKRELGLLLFPDLDALEEHLKQLQQQEQELQSQVQQGTSQSQSRRVGTQSSSSHQVPPQPLPSQQVRESHPLVASAPPSLLEALLMREANALNIARPDFFPEQHVAHGQVVLAALSPDDGTLTRTMKPRRKQIMEKYASHVARLTSRLRG